MSAKPTAFSGDYVDVKFIKTRSVAQIHIEIPLEQAAAFIASYGAPNPAEGVPVAIARLNAPAANTAPAQIENKTRQKWSELPPAQQAAIRCQEVGFRKFLARKSDDFEVFDLDMAAQEVRDICMVPSRSALNTDKEAAQRWRDLDIQYDNWQRGFE